MRIAWSFVAVLLVIIMANPIGFSAKDLDPRRLSVLYVGDPLSAYTPFIHMVEDASISASAVMAHHHGGIPLVDIHRWIRIYMPRSYEEYYDRYDVLVMSNAYRRVFTLTQLRWFRDGATEHGLGLVMVAGQESFAASSSRPDASWAGSLVEEVLPVTVPTGYQVIEHNWIRRRTMEVVDHSNEFISSLPYETTPQYMRMPVDGQLVKLKEGGNLLARWKMPELGNPPLYVTWEIGKGRTFAVMHGWTHPGSQGGARYFTKWEYYPDYAINLVHYLARWPLSTEYLTIHQYRERVHSLFLRRGMLLSLIEFVESFGGNPGQINDELRAFDSMVEAGQEHYLDRDYQRALDSAQSALDRMSEIEDLSIRVKNQALLWIYITEWLTVTGTGLLCGLALWTLMIRRRLYKGVGITRLQRRISES